MKGLVSIYLDGFRFLAALGVFFYHAGDSQVSANVFPHIFFSHFLVIVFFVISGYVIAASADRPDRTLANYSADRLARLSSVVIPALLLTYGLDAIGSRVSPEIYATINPHWQAVRFFVNLLYCQQIWFFCVNPSSNGPFWSLGYEFWYYALFGIWIFVRARGAKFHLLAGIPLFIGPKILLLLPAWAVGAMAFHAGKTWQFSYRGSLMLLVATGMVVVAALVFEDQFSVSDGRLDVAPLYFSTNFVADNIFAVTVAANFCACALFSRHLTKNFEPHREVKFIHWMASHTFSLYVYHMPILWFIRAVTKYDPHSLPAVLTAMTVTLLIIAGLSKVTEERHVELRMWLRRWTGIFAERFRRQANPINIAPATDAAS
jgi:peptidoglycan/LPS O-acetylase OafA/YrhL